MRYITSYAAQPQTQQQDQIPPYQGTDLMESIKIVGEGDSADLIIFGILGLISGPWWSFQKKGIGKWIWYSLNFLSILWGAYGASQTGGHIYLFGNKLL